MKELKFVQMEQITAGGKNRDCMIMGGITFLSLLSIPFTGWGGAGFAGATIVSATVYGCFD
ncbi:MAG: hypothetical protein RBS73_01780 [Prolixibacteraceae bacterium]|nr:hypothetical protein [Prolixibacteraceae bacterium]